MSAKLRFYVVAVGALLNEQKAGAVSLEVAWGAQEVGHGLIDEVAAMEKEPVC